MNKKKRNYSKGNKNFKGNKNAKTCNSTEDRRNSKMDNTPSYGGNDVSWYTHYADLSDSAARIPFSWQPGRQIPFVYPLEFLNENSTTAKYLYPGIMTLSFYPTVGRSTEISSPLNVCAREVYGRIRAKYSGSLEADAPDIMMYIIALDSLYMIYEDMKRVYYLLGQYTPYNTLYPKAIVEALGYDYDDLMENKVLLFQHICEAGAMLSKFLVPDQMDLFKRHQFMASNVYADSATSKSQQYAFKVGGFYTLKNTSTMTTLEITDWAGTMSGDQLTVQSAWNIFYTAIKKLMSWDTSYTIVGYLQRAFEGESFLAPTPVLEQGVLTPVYNLEVLTQIQNLNAVNVKKSSLNVTQDPTNDNILLCDPIMEYSKVSGTYQYWKSSVYDPIISLPVDNPTTTDIIISTRLTAMPIGKPTGTSGSIKSSHLTCGTEIVYSIGMTTSQAGIPVNIPSQSCNLIEFGHTNDVLTTVNYASVNALTNMIWYSSMLTNFNMHPTIYTQTIDKDNGDQKASTYISCDADNVTVVKNEHMSDLHRMCIYSEFNCFG